jgi:hypothetical protein
MYVPYLISDGRPMKIQILFVQGAGAGTHDQWDHKLVESLERGLGADYHVRYPRMPGEDDPRYVKWKAALLDQIRALDDDAILVGHSLGGTALFHVLAEERLARRLRAICSIAAPFIGDGGWPSDQIAARTDFAERLPTGVPVFLYHGTKDSTVPFEHVKLYAKTLPHAVVRALPDRDHQLDNDLSEVARDIQASGPRAR